MATVRKKAEHRYEARVQRKGHPAISKSFNNRRDAEKWAQLTEAEIIRGTHIPRREAERTTVEEVAGRFETEFAPHHYRGAAWKFKLARLREKLGKYALTALTPQVITKYRDDRLQEPNGNYGWKNMEKKRQAPHLLAPGEYPRVSSATVKGELDLLSKLLDVTQKEFGIHLPNGNPVLSIRKPSGAGCRERRLVGDEWQRLLEQCNKSANPSLTAAVLLAVETAMRQGELLFLRWEDVDLKRCIAMARNTKNGDTRAVPLSPGAVQVFHSLPRNISGQVFNMSRSTLYKAFESACERAGITDLTYHDLRHEAVSRVAERGDFTVLELAAVSGHKTLQVLKRYTHLHAENLARKMRTKPSTST